MKLTQINKKSVKSCSGSLRFLRKRFTYKFIFCGSDKRRGSELLNVFGKRLVRNIKE